MTTTAALALGALVVVAFTWGIFPLCVMAAARLRRDPAPQPVCDAKAPSVSAILATRDPVDLVAARVADLRRLDYPNERLEIVLALDHTVAGRAHEYAAALPQSVRVVKGDAPGGKPGALNAGVRAATGEVLLFADARQQFDARVARYLVAWLADERWGAVSGTVERPRDGESTLVRLYTVFDQRLRAASARLHSSMGVMGAIYAMRRANWAPLPETLILDDFHVPMRLILEGRRIGADLRAIAHETRTTDARQEATRKVRTLTGVYQVFALLPRLLVPWRNPSWALLVGIKVLRLLTPWALLVAMAAAAAAVAMRWPTAAPALLVTTAIGAGFVAWGPGRIAGRMRSLLRQFGYIQYATAVATVNGLRGRWNVWH